QRANERISPRDRYMKMKLFYGAVALVLFGIIGYRIHVVRGKNAAPAAKVEEAPLVRTAPVVRASVPETLSLTGTVRPRNEVDIFAKVVGRITAVTAQVGDKVKAGQVLGEIEHREIAWQAK